MKITLTKVKYAKFASEETHCFDAIVCLDGVPSIEASNDGRGGSTFLHDLPNKDGSVDKLEAYAATLPKKVCDWMVNTLNKDEPFSYEQDAESLVNDALEAHLLEKELKTKLRKATFFTIPSKQGVYKLPIAWGTEASQYLFKKYGGLATILNAIPFEQAVKLYAQV